MCVCCKEVRFLVGVFGQSVMTHLHPHITRVQWALLLTEMWRVSCTYLFNYYTRTQWKKGGRGTKAVCRCIGCAKAKNTYSIGLGGFAWPYLLWVQYAHFVLAPTRTPSPTAEIIRMWVSEWVCVVCVRKRGRARNERKNEACPRYYEMSIPNNLPNGFLFFEFVTIAQKTTASVHSAHPSGSLICKTNLKEQHIHGHGHQRERQGHLGINFSMQHPIPHPHLNPVHTFDFLSHTPLFYFSPISFPLSP